MYIWNVRDLFHTLSCFIMCHFMFMYVNIYARNHISWNLLSQTVNVDKQLIIILNMAFQLVALPWILPLLNFTPCEYLFQVNHLYYICACISCTRFYLWKVRYLQMHLWDLVVASRIYSNLSVMSRPSDFQESVVAATRWYTGNSSVPLCICIASKMTVVTVDPCE
jgi:hypothetical protein